LLQGDPAEAGKVLAEGLPRAVKQLGPDHYLTLQIQRALVRALAEQGRLDEAEALGKETLDAQRRTSPDQEDVGLGRTLLYLGRVLVEQGKPDEAEPLLQQALKLLRQDVASKLRPELPAQAANWLGAIQLSRKAYPEAEALMLPGSDSFIVAKAEMSPHERRLAVGHIVKLYEAWERPNETAVWQRRLADLPNNQTGAKAQ
jgi:tetratricopeptide (TPR) repeat protein